MTFILKRRRKKAFLPAGVYWFHRASGRRLFNPFVPVLAVLPEFRGVPEKPTALRGTAANSCVELAGE